jgi:hypothetical protein
MKTETLEFVDKEILRTEVIAKMMQEAEEWIKWHGDKLEYYKAQLEFLQSK